MNKLFNSSATLDWPIPDQSLDAIVTSPPYWQQRDNGVETTTGFTNNTKNIQIGQEETPQEYVEHLVKIFDGEGKRTLKSNGQLWVNLGDTFCKGLKGVPCGEPKQQLLIPFRFAIAMQDRKWVLRNTLIWAKGVAFEDGSSKGGGMPSAVHDRLNLNYEPFFGFVKETKLRKPYYLDEEKFELSWNKNKYSSKIDYFSNLDPLRIKPIWINENGQRIDFYGRVAGSRPNAGASPKQHSVSQPHSQIFNHPFGKNPGSVWLVNTDPFEGQNIKHTSPYPINLIKKIISFATPDASCKLCGLPSLRAFNRKADAIQTLRCTCNDKIERGVVFDPFIGSGTTALAALELNRNFSGLELNPNYFGEAEKRLKEKTARINKTLIEFE